MDTELRARRIGVFLGFAFGIAWTVALIVYLTGGLVNSPSLVPGGLTLAVVLITAGYMMAPALAHVLTRLVTREGWRSVYLRPRLRQSWPYWAAAWLMPAVMTILGAAIFFALFPQYFDPSLTAVRDLLQRAGVGATIDPSTFVVAQTVQAVLIAPLINGPFTFGEEFGWRSYLLLRLMALLGAWPGLLLHGAIWGFWHAPLIFLTGYNYPGHPVLGVPLFVVFGILAGVLLGWLQLASRSVLAPTIAHAALNATAGVPLLVLRGVDPAVGGVLYSPLGWLVLLVAIAIVVRRSGDVR